MQEILFPEYKIHTRAIIHRAGTQPRNTKKRMKHKIHCLLLSCISSILANAAWQMPVTNYYPKEYAAGTQNWQLKQQRNGWIYAANNYGLLEFDGESWQLYGIWNSSVIRSVEIDSDGTIYVGGANEFGKLTANCYGSLDYQPLSLDIPETYKNFGEVWNLHRHEDVLYIQTRDHIFIRPDQGELTVITPKSRIYCSALIGNGIYVATVDGIYLLTGNHLNALRGSEQLYGYEIRSLQPYGENGVLIGTDFNGIFLYDGEKIGRFQTEAENFIRKNQLYTLSVGKKYIAYGTVLNGLAITDMQGKNCRYVNTQNGLQNNTILSLLFDHDENLWLGLDQGLDKIVIESPLSLLYGQLFSYGSGYTSAIYENKIYFGTNQGLYYCNYPLDMSQQHTELQLIEGSGGQVWSLDEINGTLFCSHNRGLFIVDKTRLQNIDNSEGFWQVRSLPGTDYVIAGSYNGLYILQKQQGKYYISHKIKGFDITSRNFEIDAQGKIWIVSNRGIERLTLSEDKTTCVSELIHAQEQQNDYFHIDKINEEIILSNNHFCGIVNANGILEKREDFFNLLDGIKNYATIQKDEHNNIWYISGDALKVRQYDMKKRQFTEQPIQIIDMPRFFVGGFTHINQLGNNQAIVGSVSGFALADLNYANAKQNTEKRPILIRRMSVTSPKDSIIYGQSFPTNPPKIYIPFKNNSIRFAYSSSFCLDNTEEYCVRLLPIEEKFSSWSKSTTKEYTTLHEGNYTFEIRMRTTGDLEESKTSLSFYILPPWYRSWWAYLLWIACTMFLAYGIYLYFRHKIKIGQLQMAKFKDEEMRKREQYFAEEAHIREKEILKLQNEKTAYELRNKSQELSNLLLNHLTKNELITDVKHDLKKIADELQNKDIDTARKRITSLQSKLTRSIEQGIDWNKFEENFDMVHDKFVKKLVKQYPQLSKNEQKLCIYIHMGLYTKEIAPLMNLSTRGVEMLRYRMRKKLGLGRADSLEIFFQKLSNTDNGYEETKTSKKD